MTNLIKDRPHGLDQLEFYGQLPDQPVRIDLKSTVHEYLNYDINELDGLQPIQARHLEKCGRIIEVNPSSCFISCFKEEGVSFQLVNVVVNAYGFRQERGHLVGKPYCISLKPMEKRGEVSKLPPDYFAALDLESIRHQDWAYLDFNPFTQGYGLFGEYSSFISAGGINSHSDMVGFVINTYALATKWAFNDVCVPSMPKCNPFLAEKFKKYRTRRYFKKFESVRPRKIWGCDSPIELFLLHAMDSLGLEPEIQTGIFEDGSTYPSLHQMISANKRECEIRQITDADFYFPDQRLAIFCDSNEFHRGSKAQEKDRNIDKQLRDLGIASLRLSGINLISNPLQCARDIEGLL